ncbi:hypothetical protein [Vulcanisaeta thermophila]|uniref:hypothetical protein n=1 Tax=Vulcanisaeta thermophila TaxID=867917 RepID=UPI0008536F4E|nr:hypothetical protein [Vulcanisaeta thermophila]
MNAINVIVRIKRITSDMVKEAFIIKAVNDGVITSLRTEDVVGLYPYNAYDYRVDGKNLDYIITEDSVALLADLSKINNWILENMKYTEFNDCISITTPDGNLITTCKDNGISRGERIVYMDKVLMRKWGIDVKLEIENPSEIMPLEKYFENPMNVTIESLVFLPIYFVINPVGLGLDIIADAYINLLSKGLNRIPTNMDIADYLINIGELNDEFIKAYVMRRDLETLGDYVNIEINEEGNNVVFSVNGTRTIVASKLGNDQFLKIEQINVQNIRVNGITMNLIDIGGINMLDCVPLLIDKLKAQLTGLLK